MANQDFSTRCNMALFPFQKNEGISFSVMGKSDGDSIDNGRDLIFDPITEGLLRKLFEESNYNSFTFNSEVSFKNSLFEITYIPYYLMADLYLFNPVFPEISINLVNREELRVSRGFLLYGSGDLERTYNLSLGTSLYYYSHTQENTSFSLFDLSFRSPEELISFDSTYGLSGDLSLFFSNPTEYIPDFSFQYKNIASELNTNEGLTKSATQLESSYLFEDYMTFGLGKSYKTIYGRFSYNLELVTNNYLSDFDTENLNIGLNYTLKLLSLFMSIGERYKTFGISFKSERFNVGINFSRERDALIIQRKDENAAYIGMAVNL